MQEPPQPRIVINQLSFYGTAKRRAWVAGGAPWKKNSKIDENWKINILVLSYTILSSKYSTEYYIVSHSMRRQRPRCRIFCNGNARPGSRKHVRGKTTMACKPQRGGRSERIQMLRSTEANWAFLSVFSFSEKINPFLGPKLLLRTNLRRVHKCVSRRCTLRSWELCTYFNRRIFYGFC